MREHERAAVPQGRHGGPGAGSGSKPVSVSSAQSATSTRLRPRQRAHGYTSRPPGRTAAAASPSSVALERGQPGDGLGDVRQRASGRRRRTPSPLQGASTSTASKLPGGTGSRRAVGDHGPDVVEVQSVGRLGHPAAAGPGSTSTATTSPPSPVRSAIAVALPPGAAATSSTRSPGLRREDVDHGLAGLVLGRGPALGDRGQRRGVAGAAHDQCAGDEPAAFDRDAGARSSVSSASAVGRPRVRAAA